MKFHRVRKCFKAQSNSPAEFSDTEKPLPVKNYLKLTCLLFTQSFPLELQRKIDLQEGPKTKEIPS